MNWRVFSSLAITVMLAVASPSRAEFRYAYAGNPFTVEVGDGFTLDDFVSGYVDFDIRPAEGNSPNVVAFSFTAGPVTISDTTTGLYIDQLLFDFDAVGGVTGWNASVQMLVDGYPSNLKAQIITSWTPPSEGIDGEGIDVVFLAHSPFPPDSSLAQNRDWPGTWTPVPEPSTVTLWSLCGGVGLLYWWKRRLRAG